jgi:hypothetical protein
MNAAFIASVDGLFHDAAVHDPDGDAEWAARSGDA